jgi:hypothetical protein
MVNNEVWLRPAQYRGRKRWPMDSSIRCSRCGGSRGTVAIFVGPAGVTEASRCSECGTVICQRGAQELGRLVPFLHRLRRRAGKDS